MWLLDTSTLKLHHFTCAEHIRVEYAILSHTWEADDEEVTFQEWQDQRWYNTKGDVKTGYQKIEKACIRAKGQGLLWAWIDTCCIDKDSSAELSEAINSMWQWYYGASVCYAYLSDVPGDCSEMSDAQVTEDDSWYHDVASSKWFTRGWTLQELIAPTSLLFFGKSWNYIGRKENLIHTLSKITGVDELALEDHDALSFFVTGRKMSWAANRRTTRMEDRAYSLLGIFGITMPMLYGEGSRAFIRLQEAIITNSTDQSIFAWEWTATTQCMSEARSPPNLLLATSPDQFANCSRIVSDSRDLFGSPFRLTNQGLHLERARLLQPATGSHISYLLLNCREEHNFDGPLALPLVQDDELTQLFVPNSREVSNDYWISPKSDRVTIGNYSDAPYRQCTLMRHHPTEPLRLPKSLRTLPPKFWLVKRSTSAADFKIVGSSPPEVWDYDNRTLCLPVRQSYPDTLTTSVSITFDDEVLHVMFSFTPAPRRQKMVRNMHDLRIVASWLSLEDAAMGLQLTSVCVETQAKKLHGPRVHISVSDYMGHPHDGIYEIAINYVADRDVADVVHSLLNNTTYEPRTLRDSGSADVVFDQEELLAPCSPSQRMHFYVPGKVFELHWSETAGVPYWDDLDGDLLAHVYIKNRRFVCISNESDHCLAVPVVTYGQQDNIRFDIDVSTHAIIHTGEAEVRATTTKSSDRPALQPPIRVVADDKYDKLHPQSCVDFGRVERLDMSLNVRSFGMVHADCIEAFMMHSRHWHDPNDEGKQRLKRKRADSDLIGIV